MEKTIQITIASTTFSLTESAYEKLSGYLETLKAHFVAEPESAEIMRDIESRIAEKLFHKKHAVVTEDDVSAVIAEIGDASEFDDNTEEPEAVKSASSRRLYRDMDNAWIGGVSSGIAAYLDVDPLWVRLAFLLSLIFGGAGILIYLILWVLIPEAKNAGQKLEMRGKPVDVENIARVVREGVSEVRESGIIRRFFAMIGRFIRFGLKLIGYGFGTLLVLGGFFGTIGLLMGLGVITTNWNAPFNDFPLRGAVSEPLLVMGMLAGFVAILIPLIAVFALGIRLLTRRTIIPGIVSFGLIGIWALALSAGGTIAVKAAGDYYAYMESSPDFQVQTRIVEVAPFDSLVIKDAHVIVQLGDTQSVSVEGRVINVNDITAEVKDGALTLSEIEKEGRMCIFCSHSSPTIIVTTPSLESVTLNDGSVNFQDYRDSALTITAKSSLVRGSLEVATLNVDLERSSHSGDVISGTFTLAARDAYVSLDGSATAATISLSDTSLNARTFAITDARIEADASRAEVNVSGTLDHPRLINSSIMNVGRDELEQIDSRTEY
jgi:phage shock protein PspC (stress-responsive transcriptional regulator)